MEMNSLFYLLGGVTGKEMCVCDLKTVRVTGGILMGGIYFHLCMIYTPRGNDSLLLSVHNRSFIFFLSLSQSCNSSLTFSAFSGFGEQQ